MSEPAPSTTDAEAVAPDGAPGRDAGAATIGGRAVPEMPDLPRMHRERHAALQGQLDANDLDAMVLLGTSAAGYATGAAAPATEPGRAVLLRSVAVVVRGNPAAHVFTAYPEGVPDGHPADHVRPAAYPDTDAGAARLAGVVRDLCGRDARLAVDEVTHPLATALDGCPLTSAASMLAAAQLHKTADEVACTRHAQRITEAAMAEVRPLVRPGVAQSALSARFLRRVFELGADANGLDPIWQAMEPTRAAGPWTFTGDVSYPAPTADQVLDDGDVVWVDAGVGYAGYVSDFGRTWLATDSGVPSARQEAQFRRWRELVDAAMDACRPGATAWDVTTAAVAANGGAKAWLDHLYLAHSIGTESAELPFLGTDLGQGYEERFVLEPGVILVFEPVVWDEGAAGYRAEDMVVITDQGRLALSDFPYDPYGMAS